jgi:hypothetical protein
MPFVGTTKYCGRAKMPIVGTTKYCGREEMPIVGTTKYCGREEIPIVGTTKYCGREEMPIVGTTQPCGREKMPFVGITTCSANPQRQNKSSEIIDNCQLTMILYCNLINQTKYKLIDIKNTQKEHERNISSCMSLQRRYRQCLNKDQEPKHKQVSS